MANLPSRLARAWNVFRRPAAEFRPTLGQSYGRNPDRAYLTQGNERSIVSSIYNRIAIDVSALNIEHCRVDEKGLYIGQMASNLNYCLTIAANIDQTSRQFIRDLVMTVFDEGSAAIVPVDFGNRPSDTASLDVLTMRVGRIREWFPDRVRVLVYNDRTGAREEVILPKTMVAIVENPLYSVMNEPNSTLQRLIRKLNLLDAVDEQSSSGKLDLLVQLPYTIKSEARRREAEQRRADIEHQLKDSKYGIAYIDATEHVTQLNRSVENNLLNQIQYLTNMLYSQLGISENVANGTASEEEMLNYHNRTLDPVVSAICDSMRRTFLSRTAITQGQDIKFFRDPFKLASVEKIAEMADKFTRNEIMSSNELRSVLARPKVDDPAADELRNKNLNKADSGSDQSGIEPPEDGQNDNQSVDNQTDDVDQSASDNEQRKE